MTYKKYLRVEYAIFSLIIGSFIYSKYQINYSPYQSDFLAISTILILFGSFIFWYKITKIVLDFIIRNDGDSWFGKFHAKHHFALKFIADVIWPLLTTIVIIVSAQKYSQYKLLDALSQDTATTKAKIIERYESKNISANYVIYEYFIDQKKFVQRQNKKLFNTNDSVNIKYSIFDPNISQIIN